MPEQMTTDEINRYIHEQILEKCVHDRNYLGHVKYGTTDEFTSMHDLQSHGKYACHKCPDVSYNGGNDNGKYPDYCSDDSPRQWLNEVVDTVMKETRNPDVLAEDILLQFEHGSLVPVMKLSWLIYATAEQIARACVEAHKESKNNVQTKNKI